MLHNTPLREPPLSVHNIVGKLELTRDTTVKELVDQRSGDGFGTGLQAATVRYAAAKEAKAKRHVDTKASKGRKMRFAPIPVSQTSYSAHAGRLQTWFRNYRISWLPKIDGVGSKAQSIGFSARFSARKWL